MNRGGLQTQVSLAIFPDHGHNINDTLSSVSHTFSNILLSVHAYLRVFLNYVYMFYLYMCLGTCTCSPMNLCSHGSHKSNLRVILQDLSK